MTWEGFWLLTILLFVVFMAFRFVVKRSIKSIIKTSFDNDHILKIDYLMEEKKQGNSIRYLYSTSRTISHVVTNYALIKQGNKKQLVLKYNDATTNVNVDIYLYDNKYRLISVVKVKNDNPKETSQLIRIPFNTQFINVEKNSNVNYKHVKPSVYKILVFFESIAMFFILYFISYIIIFFVGGEDFKNYLDFNKDMNYILIIMIMASVLNLIINLNLVNKSISKSKGVE